MELDDNLSKLIQDGPISFQQVSDIKGALLTDVPKETTNTERNMLQQNNVQRHKYLLAPAVLRKETTVPYYRKSK